MPSRIEKYRMKDGQTYLHEGYFNPIWVDIDRRLVTVEAAREDYEASILAIQGHGLAQITAALQPRLDDADVQLAVMQQALGALTSVASEEYVTAAVTASELAHLAAEDPHDQYLTPTRHAQIAGNPHGTNAVQVGAEPALGLPSTDGQVLASTAGGARSWVSQGNPLLFVKTDSGSVAFSKTGAQALAIKAGTQVMVGTRLVQFAAQTAVVMPTGLAAGSDYAIYACTDGTCRASSSFTAPAGYDVSTSRLIGGFHYGYVAPGTTPAAGGFNTAAPANPGTGSMVWTQSDVDAIAGINAFSLWDLKWRPSCANPRGMALVAGLFWADIYLLGTDPAANGTSKGGTTIARGTAGAYPKVPAIWGGNGTLTYISFIWETANEVGIAAGKRLLTYVEYAAAAFGVTEMTSGAAVPATTARASGYTGRYGLEQAAGQVRVWGADLAGVDDSASNSPALRGYVSSSARAALLGGAGAEGATSGSQRLDWSTGFQQQAASIGARYRADHVVLL